MAKFLVVEHQEGGCDYTIGCGIRISEIEADDVDDAIVKYVEAAEEDYRESDGSIFDNVWEGEYAPDSIEIYQISGYGEINVADLRAHTQKEIDTYKQMEQEANEKAVLKRLQEKYNDG